MTFKESGLNIETLLCLLRDGASQTDISNGLNIYKGNLAKLSSRVLSLIYPYAGTILSYLVLEEKLSKRKAQQLLSRNKIDPNSKLWKLFIIAKGIAHEKYYLCTPDDIGDIAFREDAYFRAVLAFVEGGTLEELSRNYHFNKGFLYRFIKRTDNIGKMLQKAMYDPELIRAVLQSRNISPEQRIVRLRRDSGFYYKLQ
ncbi:TPA: hypothetical protein H1016_05305 [archaeon]|uniref:Uncharacterized protein n=1 Tax=Candidatus Naiadarchaeum limnaeum TaxID=2756139 RepID=A0A832XJQ5_9ARCH|nr:hypothetical protein [Candidatus Naiadarchaeum limnaeum]